MSERPTCDTHGCGKPIPKGGEGSPHDGSQWNACEYCSVARTRFINALEETLGVEGRNLSADEMLEVVRARLSPPPSRSDARGRPHTFWTTHRDAEPTGAPCSCSWGADHGDGKHVEEEYPAPIVEAVRALEGVRPAMVKARDALSSIGPGPSSERIGPGFPMTWHDWWEDWNEAVRQLNAALASLPKELRDAAAEKKAYR